MNIERHVALEERLPGSEPQWMKWCPVLPGPLSKRAMGFGLFTLLYGAVFMAHFVRLYRFSLTQNDVPHFSLILLVSLSLLYARRQDLSNCVAYAVRAGLSLGLLGALTYLVGLALRTSLSPTDFLSITTCGSVMVWIGGFTTFFGLTATRVALFPLGFLIFVIPPPEALLYHSITALQFASAEVTDLLFTLIDLPVLREGTSFVLPGLHIEVARECSSIRSSMALLISSVLVSHLLLRRWWSKTLVFLLVFPLAVFKNGVRIVTLSLLTIYVDTGFMHGDLHTRGGAVFFCLACVILLGILLGLRRLERWQVLHVKSATD